VAQRERQWESATLMCVRFDSGNDPGGPAGVVVPDVLGV
jgi:hypothetical protein